MTRFWVRLVFLGFALLLMASSASARSRQVGTIVLQSGRTYADASFEVDQQFKIVHIVAGEATIPVSFAEIEGIYRDGSDVTVETLGYDPWPGEAGSAPAAWPNAPGPSSASPPDSARTDQRVWLSKDSAQYRAARRARFAALVHAHAVFTTPIGDFYERTAPGVGAGADVVVPINHYVAIRGIATLTGLSWDDDYAFISVDPDVELLNQDIAEHVWRFALAAQLYRHLGAGPQERSMVYFHAGLGVAVHRISADVEWRQVSTGLTQHDSSSDTTTKLITNWGGGVMKQLAARLGFHLEGDFDLVWVGSDRDDSRDYQPYGDVRTAGIFELRAGITLLF